MEISGPEGPLEAELNQPADTCPAERLAVLCHPHPLYGGSMDDMVLASLARVLAESGIASLRFNFRGVGASAGQYSGEGGEVDDLRAVLSWIASKYPDTDLLLGGYSFGASVVAQLISSTSESRSEPSSESGGRVLLVAPPLGNLPVPKPEDAARLDLIVGSNDSFVDQQQLAHWADAGIHRIEGADHFFSGRIAELESAIRESLRR